MLKYEVDPWVVQHSLGVVVFDDAGRFAEQVRVKPDRVFEVTDVNADVESFHGVNVLRHIKQPTDS